LTTLPTLARRTAPKAANGVVLATQLRPRHTAIMDFGTALLATFLRPKELVFSRKRFQSVQSGLLSTHLCEQPVAVFDLRFDCLDPPQDLKLDVRTAVCASHGRSNLR